jgi:transposase
MLKAELLVLVKQHKHKFERYVVDELAAQEGKTVLRLPPYHCELNPIELIWLQIKNEVASKK